MRRLSLPLRALEVVAAATIAAALFLGLVGTARATAGTWPEIIVCPGCATTSLADAVQQAAPGTRIVVRGGVHPGPLVIDRPVQLIGESWPVLDGGGQGTVVRVNAPGVTIQGFVVRGSGTSLDQEDSGILVLAGPATIAGNRVEDTIFGIYLKNAHGSVIRDNVVAAKPLPIALRGDGIRVWYSNDVVMERNTARDGRDVILWFSHGGVVRDNTFERGRYGLHLMFSDGALIERNVLRASSVGLYVMYGRDTVIIGNTLTDNHGPSGMGLGLKGVDDARITGNRVVGNRMGIQLDESPRELTARVLLQGNVVAYNGVGIGFLPNVERTTLVENDFIDNIEQVGILGGGALRDITWTVDGRGNYWSDYAGYDADGDGVGDLPYRSRHLFESLIDRHEALRIFLFSPAVAAIDFSARAFPEVRPAPKLEDTGPLVRPVAAPGLAPAERLTTRARVGVGLAGFTAAIGAIVMIGMTRRSRAATPRHSPQAGADGAPRDDRGPSPAPDLDGALVAVQGLTKRYGAAVAVDDVSFGVRPGEAVALWGPNGAGKTTILRCLLGIARHTGQIRVDGIDPCRDGRAVRARVGFVPQELPVPAMTVGEFVRYIGNLKAVGYAEAERQLDLLGIGDQVDKEVGALSGGMRQRLALALALIGRPSLLLLDEPTANLDARGRAELLELLRRLKRDGMTLVFSSHRPEDVLMLADRILTIERGVLRDELSTEQFLEGLEAGSRLRLYLPEGEVPAAVAALERLGTASEPGVGVVTVRLNGRPKGALLGALTRAGVDIADFEVEHGQWTVEPS